MNRAVSITRHRWLDFQGHGHPRRNRIQFPLNLTQIMDAGFPLDDVDTLPPPSTSSPAHTLRLGEIVVEMPLIRHLQL